MPYLSPMRPRLFSDGIFPGLAFHRALTAVGADHGRHRSTTTRAPSLTDRLQALWSQLSPLERSPVRASGRLEVGGGHEIYRVSRR